MSEAQTDALPESDGDYKAATPCGKVAAMAVLSFQSSVVLGHVGNAAATLPLQRLGYEVWALDTVRLSNHPAHGGFRGRVTAAEELRELFMGVAERGVLKRCEAVASGYLGDAALGPVVLDAVAAVKKANRDAVYVCDPVMGERGRGLYVRADIPEFFAARAIPRADIVLPNLFELEQLTGAACEDLAAIRQAAKRLLARGPRLVVVKGIERERFIGVLAVTRGHAWLAESRRLDVAAHGAGDAFGAFFLAHYLKHGNAQRALARAVSHQNALMAASARRGGADLALVQGQAAWTKPKTLFRATRLG
jgi:pyridoxine kinase